MSPQLDALAILGGNVDGNTAFAVAVGRRGTLSETRAPIAQRVDLAVLVQEALQQAGMAASEVRELRVDRGPGSYIGLRVAVTFARTLAAFSGARILSAEGLEVVAAAALRANPELADRQICVLLDGRQKRVQFGAHRAVGGQIESLHAPRLTSDAEAVSQLDRNCVVLIDAAVEARIGATISASGAVLMPIPHVSASTLFAAELRLVEVSPLELEPLYLTGSYVG